MDFNPNVVNGYNSAKVFVGPDLDQYDLLVSTQADFIHVFDDSCIRENICDVSREYYQDVAGAAYVG